MIAGGMDRMEELIRTIEAAPEGRLRASALELLQSVLALHEDALQRVLALLRERGDAGQDIIRAMAKDPLVASVLSLHDLHPDSLAVRVEGALRRLEPAMASQGIEVGFLGVAENRVVQLRLRDAGLSANSRIRGLIQDAVLAAAPEIAGIAIDGAPAVWEPDFVPVGTLVKNGGG